MASNAPPKNDSGMFWALKVTMRDGDVLGTFLDQLCLDGVEASAEVAIPGISRPRRAALILLRVEVPVTWDALRATYADVSGAVYPIRCAFDRNLDEALFNFYKENIHRLTEMDETALATATAAKRPPVTASGQGPLKRLRATTMAKP